MSNGTLHGWREIADYLNRSLSTARRLYECDDLPVFKIGGMFEADCKDIDEWRESKKKRMK